MKLKVHGIHPRRRKFRRNRRKIEQGNLYEIIKKSLLEQREHNRKIYETNKNKGFLD